MIGVMNRFKVIISLIFTVGLFVDGFKEEIGKTMKNSVYKCGGNTSTTVLAYVYQYSEKGYAVKSLNGILLRIKKQ
jgi:hypothetical protein